MGQAKRRGPLEDRIAQAQARAEREEEERLEAQRQRQIEREAAIAALPPEKRAEALISNRRGAFPLSLAMLALGIQPLRMR